jgi:hypothetical protein
MIKYICILFWIVIIYELNVCMNESCLKIQNLIKLFKLIKLNKNKINS